MNNGLRRAALALLAIAVVLVATLHITSDLDPITDRLSEYATGPHGWMMTAAFIASGMGLGLLGWVVLASSSTGWHTAAGVALVVAGLGMILSGVFPTDPHSDSIVEVVHSQASGIATLTLIAAALVLAFTPDPPLTSPKVLAIAAAVLAIASFLLHETDWSGLSQRVLWAVLLAWAITAASTESPSEA